MTSSPITSPQIRFASSMLQCGDAAGMRRFYDAQGNGRRTKKDIWHARSGTLSQRQMERHPVTFSELRCLADARLDQQQIAADVFAGKQRRVSSRPADRHADINRTPGRRSSRRSCADRCGSLAVNRHEMPGGLGGCAVFRLSPHPDQAGNAQLAPIGASHPVLRAGSG